MAEPERFAQDQTEVIPSAETGDGTPDTLEIPAVPDKPAPLSPKVNPPRPLGPPTTGTVYDQLYDQPAHPHQQPPAYGQQPPGYPLAYDQQSGYPSAPPAYEQQPGYPPAPQGYEQPPGYPSAPTGATPAQVPPPPRRRMSISSRQILIILCAAIVVLIVLIGVLLGLRGHSGGTTAKVGQPAVAATATLKPTVTSFVEKGTGFRKDGSSWQTQTYSTPEFGGLKNGIGLVLDLGSAASVSSVSFDAGSGPLQVELRSADSQPAIIGGWTKVVSNSAASGSVALDGSKGGKHRYWMIWVTRLGSDDKAEISGITVKGAS